jgi:dipeptide/tripeptide permease
LNFSKSINSVKTGFHPSFWVANGMELFERLAYYGQQIIMVLYLRNTLKFSEQEAGQLSGLFGGLIYLLPILGGTLADKFGFRKAFSAAFGILAIGYFLIGSVGMEMFRPIFNQLPTYWVLVVFLILTAFGGSFIKPSVLGTITVTSTKETKSLGFAIYYWLVNIGAAIGPTIAYFVRDSLGYQYVYVVSAISCAAMFIVNLIFYKEVNEKAQEIKESFLDKMKNLLLVLTNFKFMIFLVIFSLFWIMFWQEFVILPLYVTDFIDKDAPYEIIQSWSAAGAIITLQLIINRLTKNISTQNAIVLGFGISSMMYFIIGLYPSIPTIAAGILVFAVGEMTQAPRYYEYISDIAPQGQQGLYQGYAFLPIAIAWFVGGPVGGWLYKVFAIEMNQPTIIFYILFGIGVMATVLMALYNMFINRAAKN